MTENPGELVEQAVERSLKLVVTWPAWDGEPRMSDDGRTFTPHKAVRRIADHMVDHLAEVEALLAGVPTQPDEWHASALTSAADLAPFSEEGGTAALIKSAASRCRTLSAGAGEAASTAWSVRQVR
ncbi:hypothetical protein [Kribbella pratensis]|uniref:DinB family protein n=1 Tax=Kribbella pratensis TaxID=2512112 RepID=A0A4R8C595_9ACTN|nr:hypothetical protein [Kribbella pratensis]TDW71072.1 hypothetical protein EV653_5142 [Kribbella pratensis]